MLRSEVEKKTGLSRKAIEYYEEKNLINPKKDENDYRVYSKNDLEILIRVSIYRKLGLSVEEIKKLTFKNQLYLGLAIVLIGFILTTITKNGIFSNIGWSIYGILFIVNPVEPKKYKGYSNLKKWIRISGIMILILGLITKFNL